MILRVLALSALLAAAAPALANDQLLGDWRGVYRCDPDTTDRQMTLSIKTLADGRATGVLEFRTGLYRGSLNVAGAIDATGSFRLEPGDWIIKSPGFPVTGLQGALTKTGDRTAIRGTFTGCRSSSFMAFPLAARPSPQPSPVMNPNERDADAWTRAVRARIREFTERRETNPHWWNQFAMQVRRSRIDPATRDWLVAEVLEGRAALEADIMLDELASAPKTYPQAIGRALFLHDRAQRRDWPEKAMQRVKKALQAHAMAAMRPELLKAAELAKGQPASLDTLVRAREALWSLEDYRASMERAFGTMDPEGLLAPLRKRIVELDADPGVAKEFRAALHEAQRQPSPLRATKNVIERVLGPDESRSALATIAEQERKAASFSEVAVENRSSAETRGEPSAQDMARLAHEYAESVNGILRAMRCTPGPIYGADKLLECSMGELEARLTRIVKLGCREEKPDLQYVCRYTQDTSFVSGRTGEPFRDLPRLRIVLPNVEGSGEITARYIRNGLNGGWTRTRLASP
ncbi:MAG: hypothetical protein K2X62_08045 [Beijerinckiaceae bacterium]|nr:hypothetical protein [Beijerinckiaceae bacterium]